METRLHPEAETPAQTKKAVEVSVVIPCLNEANSLGICIDKAIGAFAAAGLSWLDQPYFSTAATS